jgi:hypothetical protein
MLVIPITQEAEIGKISVFKVKTLTRPHLKKVYIYNPGYTGDIGRKIVV